MQGPSLVTRGGSVREGGVKNEQAPVKLGWLRNISADRTKRSIKRQPASETKVRDRIYKKDGKCETKIAGKEKENKRER